MSLMQIILNNDDFVALAMYEAVELIAKKKGLETDEVAEILFSGKCKPLMDSVSQLVVLAAKTVAERIEDEDEERSNG